MRTGRRARAAAEEVARRLEGDPRQLHRFAEGSSSAVWRLPQPPTVLLIAPAETPRAELDRKLALARWLDGAVPRDQQPLPGRRA